MAAPCAEAAPCTGFTCQNSVSVPHGRDEMLFGLAGFLVSGLAWFGFFVFSMVFFCLRAALLELCRLSQLFFLGFWAALHLFVCFFVILGRLGAWFPWFDQEKYGSMGGRPYIYNYISMYVCMCVHMYVCAGAGSGGHWRRASRSPAACTPHRLLTDVCVCVLVCVCECCGCKPAGRCAVVFVTLHTNSNNDKN